MYAQVATEVLREVIRRSRRCLPARGAAVERPFLEVADIFRRHGPAWREQQRGHLRLGQLKVMTAIERCRTAALGGHVLRCEACGVDQISCNSCRNRHCPKCQAAAAQHWLHAREADLLPVEYYHVVFTLPAPVAAVAYQNKALIYGMLFDVAAEVLQTIAADLKHLGARIGATLVLHTWGSALTHHPHVHGIVPGGGLSPAGDGSADDCVRPMANAGADQRFGSSRAPTLEGACQQRKMFEPRANTASYGSPTPEPVFESP
jgi:hypothetical protein